MSPTNPEARRRRAPWCFGIGIVGLVVLLTGTLFATYRRESYVGAVTCRLRVDTYGFGLLVDRSYRDTNETVLLESLLGEQEEVAYVCNETVAFYWWERLQSPPGNLRVVSRMCEAEREGVDRDLLRVLAERLVQDSKRPDYVATVWSDEWLAVRKAVSDARTHLREERNGVR